MNRRTAYGIFLISLFFLSGAGEIKAQNSTQSSTPVESQNARLSLNGTWQFALAANATEAERLARFYEASFDARDFRPIPVPSNWVMQGFDEPVYDRLPDATEGFYLYRFRQPTSLEGKRAVLHFDGVWDSAEVWLNGQALGRHDSGFTSFAFDVTPQLKGDAENTLAVRVRTKTKDSFLDTNDDWSLPGIFRDVWLEFMPRSLHRPC